MGEPRWSAEFRRTRSMNERQAPALAVSAPVVARTMSPIAHPGIERLLYGRGSARFAGVPVEGSAPNEGARVRRVMQPPSPGSLTIGCWKSATPAVRAMIAIGESTWTRFVRHPEEKPAPSESPTNAMRVRSTCAAAGRATAATRVAARDEAETRRRKAAGVFMFFCAPLERRLDRDARQDRERLVGAVEVVLVRRDRS